LVGDAAVRVAWNRALAEAAIPSIVEKLISSIPERVKEADPITTYALWPEWSSIQSRRAWISEIGTGIVGRLATLPMVRMRRAETSRWLPVRDARCEVGSWSTSLTVALLNDGFELVDPPLPSAVVNTLRKLKAMPAVASRSELCGWLSREVDCWISDAPLECLRKPEFVRALLEFFVGGQSQQLSGLPLALRENGSLRTFNDTDTILLASADIRRLFRRWGIAPRNRITVGAPTKTPLGKQNNFTMSCDKA
jgi:hypothetical protein